MKNKLHCILLIDDNPADNVYHKTVIEEMHITDTVEIAENGLEAIKFITKENQIPPDMIFLDINMPKMNGWEFLEAYKNLDKKNKTEVIVMLTTSQNPEDKKRAAQIKEINGFMTKPMSDEGLKEIIEKHFSHTPA